ncbi:hypothetical protein PCANC_07254 [Puccinia coronata f. sp. avenae]|uniref:Uncharacterized protein n=1 Tax=Puccinia coronata f. sp. avenae TaxID=200324 RepID=A0A2N5TYR5_9BASI|nr:hypothetical protein PCASD_17775 [Puccinia coronata f. sp. avenae]PLW42658.1 hypothetical protein PCASD_08478 [Puccinia coronata f. sp. avenae]PLW52745.1 hypothetical protein PCANC_07254 [Puccinia coronata f. sp. avenae]
MDEVSPSGTWLACDMQRRRQGIPSGIYSPPLRGQLVVGGSAPKPCSPNPPTGAPSTHSVLNRRSWEVKRAQRSTGIHSHVPCPALQCVPPEAGEMIRLHG